ncbi:exo-beta-N-acetylmuramidase NamZ domain-containing protein [Cupriavidus pinatubonensis]|uniref:exo-beta-N-acetylmuramidase NamZ domain-containing protein n=1 Tax=Cupriavidus pinatubonensis TaxID=248026 RepID=UPI001CC55433|nr:exo-beta-N-acetylmuramidase NamZ domain-containing protein [Cupriavidus pinatubonensis]
MESSQSLRSRYIAALICVAVLLWACLSAAGASPLPREALDAVVAGEIAHGNVAGAVVIVGDAQGVRYRTDQGWRTVGEAAEAMSPDTVFDLASLTKAVATASAIMQLVERGAIALDAPASRYWAAFGAHGKGGVTIRQLLAHTSGLPAGVSSTRALRGRRAVLADIVAMARQAEPGTRVIYSDINYVVLGEIVERASGMPLDAWCAARLFEPLGMTDTGFRPGPGLTPRIAPTTFQAGHRLRGQVHDPIAAAMGGVAGNAGLFSTADDLARFARMLLGDGQLGANRVLSHDSVTTLMLPDKPAGADTWRSAGWALQAPLAENRFRMLYPVGMLEHLGYTGTGLWVDMVTRQFVVILTSRLYPGGAGDAAPLRAQVLGMLASRASPLSIEDLLARIPELEAGLPLARQLPQSTGPVRSGVDVLASRGFAPLAGRRVGLITNRSGFDSNGVRTVDRLAQAPGVRLTVILAPEHGLDTDLDATFGDTTDARTGVPIRSLYGTERRIAPQWLDDVDVLVFDVQDAGVRFFTYLSTLGYALEAVAKARIPLIVLDRPNPLGADLYGGPVLDATATSFTGYYPLALLHGMTVGELAGLFNQRLGIGAELEVVPMEHYRRGMSYADTGLGWVPISPNLRDTKALSLYADVGLLEGANVSVGRGTRAPFSVLGAPWIRADELARTLNAVDTGAKFKPMRFVPTEGPHRGIVCEGVAIQRLPGPVRPGRIGLALALALRQSYPDQFNIDAIRASVGSRTVWEMLRDGRPLDFIDTVASAQAATFAAQREAFLLY